MQNVKEKYEIEKASGGFATRLLLAVASGVCIILFQNCGADFVTMDSDKLSSLGSFVCSGDHKVDFSKTYYPFFKTNCASCHSNAAPVNFAQNSLEASFIEFEKTNVDKIRQYALNPNHGSGAGGPEHQAAIDSAAASYASCKDVGGGSAAITARTTALAMTATTTAALRTIDLDSQMQMGAGNFGGAKLHFQVRTDVVSGMQVYYIIKPSLQTASSGIAIKGIYIRINGTLIETATTFTGVNKTFNPGTAGLTGQTPNGNLSLGTAVIEVPGGVVATDTVQFEFETLKVQ